MERDHSIAHARYYLVLLDWDFRDHVTVDPEISFAPEYGLATGETGSKKVVRPIFNSRTVNVNQSQVVTVKTHEKGLGQSDGHVVLTTVQFHSLSWRMKKGRHGFKTRLV